MNFLQIFQTSKSALPSRISSRTPLLLVSPSRTKKKNQVLSSRTVAGHGKLLMAALRKGEAARFYINFGAPRTIDITKIEQWEKGRMLSVRMEQEGFNKLSGESHYISNIKPWYSENMAIVEDVEAEASRSGKVFVPVPNYRETPKQWPTIGMNDQEAEECVGWAYYAKSLNWVRIL